MSCPRTLTLHYGGAICRRTGRTGESLGNGKECPTAKRTPQGWVGDKKEMGKKGNKQSRKGKSQARLNTIVRFLKL